MQLTATSNESFHSVAGHVSRKLRASMLPETIELLALAKVMMRNALKYVPDLTSCIGPDGILDTFELDDLLGIGGDEDEGGCPPGAQ